MATYIFNIKIGWAISTFFFLKLYEIQLDFKVGLM